MLKLNKVCFSLRGSEGQLKVVFAVRWCQTAVVKLGGEEGVHQGAEGHPITPAGGEVLDVDVLQRNAGSTQEKPQRQQQQVGVPLISLLANTNQMSRSITGQR